MQSPFVRFALPLILLAAQMSLACGGLPEMTRGYEAQGDSPYVLVLGTAQDGGLPQIGCRQVCCEAVREDSTQRRMVTSLLLVDPGSEQRWLFDASPDLPTQVERARGHVAPTRKEGAGRPPLFDGIFLTHAHVGHYTGLLHLGREAYGSGSIALHASPRMLDFLGQHGPWSLILKDGYLEPQALVPGQTLQLTPSLSVTAIPVPHREEFSDTVAFLIRGPERALLYLPDIDKWDRWEHWENQGPWRRSIEGVVAEVDFALLDGTFFGDGEIPGRAMEDIPHPFISESLQRFASLPALERAKIFFTHLNHTNPAAIPGSSAQQTVQEAGMSVARERQVFEL
ncbi:MAG: pyrroloquinoline quinone biosynthesis protein B [Planctomycetota bacterium]|jgi:pyrroloquinoline quinone biosynthesis protein B